MRRLASLFCFFLVFLFSTFSLAADATHYIITNDDVPAPVPNTVTFYTVASGGKITAKTSVSTGGNGIGGGYFGTQRVNTLHNGKTACVYASNAQDANVTGINVKTLKPTGRFNAGKGDGGTSNGIGLAMNDSYLYASFTDSNTIGTYQVLPGCKLKFVQDIAVGGLEGGIIDAMKLNGNIMVVTYGDGSIESFNISAGVPVSNGDEQNSTGSKSGNTYPSDVDITQDGHYAIFGDTSVFTVIEVSDISSGKLTPTIVYHLGSAINSSNILLSPDETLLYIANTQGDKITAAFFDSSTGVVTKGCTSGYLKGYDKDWSYLAGFALQSTTGTGNTLYVAEFGAPSSIGVLKVTSSNGTCSLKEASYSPVADPNSPGLLSIGMYPPRPF